MNSNVIEKHRSKASYSQGCVVRKRLSTVHELDLDLEYDLELTLLTACGRRKRYVLVCRWWIYTYCLSWYNSCGICGEWFLIPRL